MLPRPIAPFPGETTKSYLYRLGVANQLQDDDLLAHLTGTRRHARLTVEALAHATGRSPHSLRQALPELRHDTTPGRAATVAGHTRRPVCRHCAARRGEQWPATSWQPTEQNLCPTHQIWLGPPARFHRGDQHDLSALPEILAAQHRHYRLARRHGRSIAADAFTEAAHITEIWTRHGFYHGRREPLIHAMLGNPPLIRKRPPGDPITPIVTYPETVDLARVLAMPRWRHPTAWTNHDLREFQQDVNQYTGIPYYPQESPYDPLLRWFQRRHTTAA